MHTRGINAYYDEVNKLKTITLHDSNIKYTQYFTVKNKQNKTGNYKCNTPKMVNDEREQKNSSSMNPHFKNPLEINKCNMNERPQYFKEAGIFITHNDNKEETASSLKKSYCGSSSPLYECSICLYSKNKHSRRPKNIQWSRYTDILEEIHLSDVSCDLKSKIKCQEWQNILLNSNDIKLTNTPNQNFTKYLKNEFNSKSLMKQITHKDASCNTENNDQILFPINSKYVNITINDVFNEVLNLMKLKANEIIYTRVYDSIIGYHLLLNFIFYITQKTQVQISIIKGVIKTFYYNNKEAWNKYFSNKTIKNENQEACFTTFFKKIKKTFKRTMIQVILQTNKKDAQKIEYNYNDSDPLIMIAKELHNIKEILSSYNMHKHGESNILGVLQVPTKLESPNIMTATIPSASPIQPPHPILPPSPLSLPPLIQLPLEGPSLPPPRPPPPPPMPRPDEGNTNNTKHTIQKKIIATEFTRPIITVEAIKSVHLRKTPHTEKNLNDKINNSCYLNNKERQTEPSTTPLSSIRLKKVKPKTDTNKAKTSRN